MALVGAFSVMLQLQTSRRFVSSSSRGSFTSRDTGPGHFWVFRWLRPVTALGPPRQPWLVITASTRCSCGRDDNNMLASALITVLLGLC